MFSFLYTKQLLTSFLSLLAVVVLQAQSATRYSPEKVAALDNKLEEVSAVQYWPERKQLLMLNDGGHPAHLYVCNTQGDIQQTIVLEGIQNEDWEAMGQDATHFYVADVGNNQSGNRKNLAIYMVPKKLIVAGKKKIVIPASAIGKIGFSYADQTDYSAVTGNNTRFDCEAIVVHQQQVHLFSKNWAGSTSYHYTMPAKAGHYKATLVDSLHTGAFKITDAAYHAKGWLLLTAYSRQGAVQLFAIAQRGTAIRLAGNVQLFTLPPSIQTGQLESVCFETSNSGWLATEAFGKKGFQLPALLYRFQLPLRL